MSKFRIVAVNIILATVLALTVVLNFVASYWSGALTLALGTVGGEKEGTVNEANYFTSEFSADDDLIKAQEQFSIDVVEEGAVLLKNDNDTLPLAEDERTINVFSINQREWIRNGSGSSSIPLNPNYSTKTIISSLKDAGLTINPTLEEYYFSLPYTSRKNVGNKILEQPWADVLEACGKSWNAANEVALVIFSRVGGEGSDCIRDMSNAGGTVDEHYLELNQTERELLEGIASQGFKKTIVLLNSCNAIQMDFLDEERYDIDACFWVGGTGLIGSDAVGRLLTGELTPSGHLTDTYLKDNFATPAMKSFGLNNYVDADGKRVGNKYSYVNYCENIYLGYRYFESRYEALMLGDPNVGNYDYDAVVSRPFGYGLTYTSFKYSNMQMTVDSAELGRDKITVSIDVENTGKRDGKDAIEVYFQAPYTAYDKENGVEKSSICLANYAKTPVIKAGEKVTVTVSFDAEDIMKSYDANKAKAYIMDDGDYYITVGEDAHAAINNILKVKGVAVDGDADLVKTYNVKNFKVIDKDLATGNAITNQFDYAKAQDAVYLTRENWALMDDDSLVYGDIVQTSAHGVLSASHLLDSDLKAKIDAVGWESSGIPASAENNADVVWGQEGDLELIQLRGLPYDDPMWDQLLSQVKLSEAHEVIATAGYNTAKIASINKPKTFDCDGTAGLWNMLNGWAAFEFPSGTIIGTTWNQELQKRFGELVGEDGLRSAATGWYAPSFDMHRTAFSGRNNEYYSEDPILSGRTAAAVVKGALSKGMISYIKHLALNDMETNRSNVCTWATEQSIREIYLRAFEIAIKDGGANGVMTGMNRIGYIKAISNYSLTTGVLRNEWNFHGIIVSDITSDATLTDGMLSSGADTMLTTGMCRLTTTAENKYQNLMKEVIHRICYNVVNSSAMNGYTAGSKTASEGIPVYMILLGVLDVLVALAIILAEIGMVKSYRKAKQEAKN
ncbi:MAG: glycoside hydrolase family 3 C-terminal domain-containing protein [Lachnospiraceae bacterium]|nr:glycoside hydrolase family 3 C-terminal domain-containing protein [Lachnospiraceae bacterium]